MDNQGNNDQGGDGLGQDQAGRGGRGGRRRGRRGGRGRDAALPPEPPQVIPNEVSVILGNLGFPQALHKHVAQVEQIRALVDFLILHKDVIYHIFTRLDNAGVAYSALQLSMFKSLHHYV